MISFRLCMICCCKLVNCLMQICNNIPILFNAGNKMERECFYLRFINFTHVLFITFWHTDGSVPADCVSILGVLLFQGSLCAFKGFCPSDFGIRQAAETVLCLNKNILLLYQKCFPCTTFSLCAYFDVSHNTLFIYIKHTDNGNMELRKRKFYN